MRRKEADERVVDRKQSGNGRGEERTGISFLPGHLREEAVRNKWENIDLESGGFEVKVARKCWVCADKVGPQNHRAVDCPER